MRITSRLTVTSENLITIRFAIVVIAAWLQLCAISFAAEQSPYRESAEAIAALIEERYVDEAVAKEVASLVRAYAVGEKFARITDPRDAAAALTALLKPYDSHFTVTWKDPEARPSPETLKMLPETTFADWAALRNHGFSDIRRLPGNIGYLNLIVFSGVYPDKPEFPATEAATHALSALSGADAIIIDLRQNPGGAASMVEYLASFFFDSEPRLLGETYYRSSNEVYQSYTLQKVYGPRFPETPLYLIVNGRTASAAEVFAASLSKLGRAIIIGEITGGYGNPGRDYDAGGGFSVFISTGRAVDKSAGADVEKKGVVPDITVPSREAFDAAYKLALENVIARNTQANDAFEARWALGGLREPARLSKKKMAAYVGEYNDYAIYRDRNVLRAAYKRRPHYALSYIGDDMFAIPDLPGARLLFERDERGNIVRLVELTTFGEATAHLRQ